MPRIADWSWRKQEIGAAFRRVTPLPAEADTEFYGALLSQMCIDSSQDFAILYMVVEDAIRQAYREERPTAPLEAFKDWLQAVRRG